MSIGRGYIATSFGQVHYRYAGTPGAPVLLLLHQTPSTSAMYEPMMRALSPHFRLIAPDTPGMGMSDASGDDLTIPGLAKAIGEFLDELGVVRCYVFGHHTGASIAAELAAQQPSLVQAIALSGPPLLTRDMREKLPSLASSFDVREDGQHLASMWQRIRDKDHDAPLEIIERETINGLRLGDRYGAAYDAVIEHDIAAAMTSLECPALVFAGTEDILYSQLDAAFELLKHGERRSIDGARTFVCETEHRLVAELLQDFFLREAA